MKQLAFALVFVSSLNAMDAVVKTLEELDTDDMELTFEFKRIELILNGKSCENVDSNVLFSKLDRALALFKVRCDVVQAMWANKSETPSEGMLKDLEQLCSRDMQLLEELLKQLHNALYVTISFRDNEMLAYDIVSDVLNLYERLHGLRVAVCKAWQKQYRVKPVALRHVGKRVQGRFNTYINVLTVNIKAATWFERMRKNDL